MLYLTSKRVKFMALNNQTIMRVSFKDVVINDRLLRYYENNMSEMPAGSFDLIGKTVVIYRYSIPGNVAKDNNVAKRVEYYDTHRLQYVSYYKRLCKNYAALPVKLVGANPYSNILLKYVAEISAIAEGFLVSKENPSKADVLEAVLKSAKGLEKQKDVFVAEHMSLDLAGAALGAHTGNVKPVYDDNFKKLCRQFLTFGNICLLDLDKNSDQAKQVRKLFADSQKYYENCFANNAQNGAKQIEVQEKRLNVNPAVLKVAQNRKKVSQY